MNTTKEELLSALKSLAGKKILLIGDLILDEYIWGGVTRISQEAPVPVVEVKKTEYRLGGAGNVAQNLANLGVTVFVAGLVGGDEEAKSMKALMQKNNIQVEGVVTSDVRPTTIKTRVIAHQQQVCRIDKESRMEAEESATTRLSNYVASMLPQVDGVILSDYGKGVVTAPLLTVIESAHARGELNLRHARPYAVDPSPANYHLYSRMSFAKPNRSEAIKATGIEITDVKSAVDAASLLIRRWGAESMLISLGADGLVIVFADKSKPPISLPTFARRVFDVSGAGDCVTAVYTAALAAGATPTVAGALANAAAGYVVSEVGTVAITKEALINEINHLAP
jgi:rfaE bifunctional protein kinase chain/domain